jgi:hypothetical protein
VKLFTRRTAEDAYVERAERVLTEAGWRRVGGMGLASVWTTGAGHEWLPLEAAVDELAHNAWVEPDKKAYRDG